MISSETTIPQYRRGQIAYFIGGQGIIKNYQQESGRWAYVIEMELGPEPASGRIGYETMVCLFENELTVGNELIAQ
jgi:hypothetical protein